MRGIPIDVDVNGKVDGFRAGVYKIEYSAADLYGNLTVLTRTITVADSLPPKLNLFGPRDLVIEAGEDYIEFGGIQADELDGILEATAMTTVDNLKPGKTGNSVYNVDKAGNVGSVYRYVTVVDTSPPIIKLQGLSIDSIELGKKYFDSGIIAMIQSTGE